MSNEAEKMKKSKRALVPKLRFPEFKGAAEWKARPLREMCDRILDKVGDTQLTPVSISAGNGFLSQVERFGRDISGAQYKNYIWLRQGDFAYNKGNSQSYPQGCVMRLKEFDQAAAPSAYISFRLHDDCVPEFFEGLFEMNVHGRQLIKFITSSARSDGLLNISPDDFFSVSLPIPQDPVEQQKIADCLTTLDDLITTEADQLDALKAHKKGLLQQLFPREGETTPRLRFPEFRDKGEWESTNIGEHVNLQSGFPFEGKDIVEDSAGVPLMRGINITEGRIRHDPDYDRFYLEPAENLAKYRLQEGDLVIGMDGSKVGKNSAMITSADAGALLVQRVARLRSDRQVTMRFIFQHVNSPKFHSYVDRINTSSGIPHISAKQIKYFPLALPCDAEQERIADCLTSLDDLITAQAEKIETLKTHKKGLMQQLFPTPEVR